jgi:hypothetical protein
MGRHPSSSSSSSSRCSRSRVQQQQQQPGLKGVVTSQGINTQRSSAKRPCESSCQRTNASSARTSTLPSLLGVLRGEGSLRCRHVDTLPMLLLLQLQLEWLLGLQSMQQQQGLALLVLLLLGMVVVGWDPMGRFPCSSSSSGLGRSSCSRMAGTGQGGSLLPPPRGSGIWGLGMGRRTRHLARARQPALQQDGRHRAGWSTVLVWGISCLYQSKIKSR